VRSNGEAGILREADRSVYFATENRSKYLEASRVADAFGIRLKHLRLEKREIQSERLSNIASFAARQAAATSLRKVVCEDAGFFVEALRGFPGPYSSYVFKAIGIPGILKLMRGTINRNAAFQAAAAYCEPGRHPVCFTGSVEGIVSRKPKGFHGFGFDPIFIPANGDGRTFAEMPIAEKNALSHRAKAFAEFSKWFLTRRPTGRSQTS
jgi:XTP/dITP diphosphohydrolase